MAPLYEAGMALPGFGRDIIISHPQPDLPELGVCSLCSLGDYHNALHIDAIKYPGRDGQASFYAKCGKGKQAELL